MEDNNDAMLSGKTLVPPESPTHKSPHRTPGSEDTTMTANKTPSGNKPKPVARQLLPPDNIAPPPVTTIDTSPPTTVELSPSADTSHTAPEKVSHSELSHAPMKGRPPEDKTDGLFSC